MASTDPIPKARALEVQAAVDAGVVHPTATAVYRYGISFNKVFDCMASRNPIAFARATWNRRVAAAGAGRSMAPDDPEALAEAFLALASASPAERCRIGGSGRDYVEREYHMARIGSTFAEIVGVGDAVGGREAATAGVGT